MTVQSPSEDTASSDDVYSSVPEDTTANNTLERKEDSSFLMRGKDKFGPLPAVPSLLGGITERNASFNKIEVDNINDENNNYRKESDSSTTTRKSSAGR